MGRIKNWDKRVDNQYKQVWTNRLTGNKVEVVRVAGKEPLWHVYLHIAGHEKPVDWFHRTKEFALKEAIGIMKRYAGTK
jgi:hypothetical protein